MSDLFHADIEAFSAAVTALRCANNEIKRLANKADARACEVTLRTIDDAIATCERMAGVRLPYCTNPRKAPEIQPTAVELEMRRANKPVGDYECEVLMDGKESNRNRVLAYWNGNTLHWGRESVRISEKCKPRLISGPLVRLPMQWLESHRHTKTFRLKSGPDVTAIRPPQPRQP